MLLQQSQASGGILSFLPLFLILGIFYLIVFLPARRRQKKLQEMIDTNFKFYKQITDDPEFSRMFFEWLFDRYLKSTKKS